MRDQHLFCPTQAIKKCTVQRTQHIRTTTQELTRRSRKRGQKRARSDANNNLAMVNNIRISPLITSTKQSNRCVSGYFMYSESVRDESAARTGRCRHTTLGRLRIDLPRSSTSYQPQRKATHTVLRPSEILDRYNFSLHRPQTVDLAL